MNIRDIQPTLILYNFSCTNLDFQNTTKNTTLVVLTFVSPFSIVVSLLPLIRIVNRISAREGFWFPTGITCNRCRWMSIEK